MRKLWATAAAGLCCAGLNAGAATYYVDAVAGDDGNDGGQVNSVIRAWKTVSEVNQRSLQPGDSVLFKRGDTWRETLVLRSGVNYSDYGDSGLGKPVISGSKPVGSLAWTLHGGNIYRADVSGPVTQLFLGGDKLPRARHPNVGSGDFGPGSRYLRASVFIQQGQPDKLVLDNVPDAANLAGAEVFARTLPWLISRFDVAVAPELVGGHYRVALKPHAQSLWTSYGPQTGWGFWMENRLAFLDQPGEWVYSAGKLYVWMPDGLSPQGRDLRAAVRESGIVSEGATGFRINNLEVRETTGDAVKIRQGGAGFGVGNLDVLWAGGRGIAVTGSTDGWIAGARVEDSMREGIWMGNYGFPCTLPSSAVHVVSSTVRRAGKDYYASAAIALGHSSFAKDNVVEDPIFGGIGPWHDSRVENNVVRNACSGLDDCGAFAVIGRGYWNITPAQMAALSCPHEGHIDPAWRNSPSSYGFDYRTGQPMSITFVGNVADGANGWPDGQPPDKQSSGKGFYMDDWTNVVLLENNFVTNTDDGYHLHNNRYLTMRGNTGFGNRRSQIFMQENTGREDEGGLFDCGGITGPCDGRNYMQQNTIEDNLLVSTTLAPVVSLASTYQSTSDFAAFNGNHYVALVDRFIVRDYFAGSPRLAKTFGQWQARNAQDTNSSQTIFGPNLTLVSATPLFPNATLETGDPGVVWESLPQLNRSFPTGPQCRTGRCMELDPQSSAPLNGDGLPGGSVFTRTSTNPALFPGFDVQLGKTYLVSFDAKGGAATGDALAPILRSRNSAGASVNISDSRPAELTPSWQRFHRWVRVGSVPPSKTRLDLEIATNGLVFVDNVSLIEFQVTPGPDGAYAFYNASNTKITKPCPAIDQSRCGEYFDARTGAPVPFPLTLDPWTWVVAYWKTSPWRDSDFDGVADTSDNCPGTTPLEAGVDIAGCPLPP